MRPQRWQPTRAPCPCDSPGKNTGVGCHFLLQCLKVKSESEVAQSCPTRSDPMDCSHQAPLSMGFSRQEYWSGVPLPSPTTTIAIINPIKFWTNCPFSYSPKILCSSFSFYLTFFFVCIDSLLRHARAFVVVCGLFIGMCRLLSNCDVQAPEYTGSVVVAQGLSRPAACKILVRQPGIKPTSPALEGRFLTTGPTGKYSTWLFQTCFPLHYSTLTLIHCFSLYFFLIHFLSVSTLLFLCLQVRLLSFWVYLHPDAL